MAPRRGVRERRPHPADADEAEGRDSAASRSSCICTKGRSISLASSASSGSARQTPRPIHRRVGVRERWPDRPLRCRPDGREHRVPPVSEEWLAEPATQAAPDEGRRVVVGGAGVQLDKRRRPVAVDGRGADAAIAGPLPVPVGRDAGRPGQPPGHGNGDEARHRAPTWSSSRRPQTPGHISSGWTCSCSPPGRTRRPSWSSRRWRRGSPSSASPARAVHQGRMSNAAGIEYVRTASRPQRSPTRSTRSRTPPAERARLGAAARAPVAESFRTGPIADRVRAGSTASWGSPHEPRYLLRPLEEAPIGANGRHFPVDPRIRRAADLLRGADNVGAYATPG